MENYFYKTNLGLILLLTNLVLNSPLLAQDSGFKLLRTGEVRPLGWLKTQMEQDISTGYARYLPQLTNRCHLDIYKSIQLFYETI